MTSLAAPAPPWPPSVIPAVWPPPLPGVTIPPPPPPPPPPQPSAPILFPQVPQIQQVQPPVQPPQAPATPPNTNRGQPTPGGNVPINPITPPTTPLPGQPSQQQNRTSILPSVLERWGKSLQGSLFGQTTPTVPIGHTTIAIGSSSSTPDRPQLFIVDTITDNEKIAILIITLILSALSIIAAILMIGLYFLCRYIYPTLVDRITLRICVLIAAVDLLYAVNQTWSAFVSTHNTACAFSVWSYIFLTLLFIFLTDAIAFNLHMVFLMERRNTGKFEKWYYIIPFSLAAAATVPGWAAGRYGYDPSMKTCWFVEQGATRTLVWEFMSYYTWAVLGILYCLLVVVMVLVKLFQQRRKLEKALAETASKSNYRYSRKVSAVSRMSGKRLTKQMHNLSPEQIQLLQQREASKETGRIVLRIVRYPMIPIFTQAWNLANDLTLYLTKRTFFWLLLMCYIATSLQGVLNFLAFCYDPSFQLALDELRSDAIEWYMTDEMLLVQSGMQGQERRVFTLRKRIVRAWVWLWYIRKMSPEDASTMASDTVSQATLEQLNKTLAKIEEEDEYDEEEEEEDDMAVEITLPSPPAYPLPALQPSIGQMERGSSLNESTGQYLRPSTSSGETVVVDQGIPHSRRSSGIRSRGNSLSSAVPPQF